VQYFIFNFCDIAYSTMIMRVFVLQRVVANAPCVEVFSATF